MPFQKSYKRRVSIRATQPATNRRSAFVSQGRAARAAGLQRARDAQAAARIMNMMGVEKKFLDSSFTGTVSVATDATGGEMDPATLLCLTTPVQDDTPSGREGKRITCKYIEIKGTLDVAPAEIQANPQQGNQVLVAMVLDMQTNQAQMNSEDCFKNTAANALTNATPLRNLLFADRFRILKSEVFDLTPKTLSHFAVDSFSVAGRTVSFNWFVPLKDMPVNFNATATGVIGNVIDNSIHIIAFSTATGQTTTLTYNARLRFVG